METFAKYVIFIAAAVVIYIIYCKIINAISSLSKRRGLDYKINITITDDKTELNRENSQQTYSEPNIVMYMRGNRRAKKLLLIGSSGELNTIKKKFANSSLREYNFVNEFDNVIQDMSDFWYQYITYLATKYKKILGLPRFSTPSLHFIIAVSSKEIREKIRSEIDKTRKINRPKLFNIM